MLKIKMHAEKNLGLGQAERNVGLGPRLRQKNVEAEVGGSWR